MLGFTIKYRPLLKVNVLPSAHRVELVGEADNGTGPSGAAEIWTAII